MDDNAVLDTQISSHQGMANNRSTAENPVVEREESFDRRTAPLNKTEALRASIRRSIEEEKEKASDKVGFSDDYVSPRTKTDDEPEADEALETEAVDAAEPEGETEAKEQAKAANEAPPAWDKKAKAEWAALPDKVKAAVLKREKDVEAGVQNLRNQYKEFDDYRKEAEAFLSPVGVSLKDFARNSLAYARSFAGPQKLRAYMDLGRQIGIDPSMIFGAIQQHQNQANPGDLQAQLQQLPPIVGNYLNQLSQRLNVYENQTAENQNKTAKNIVDSWAKDKPYFKSVQREMARLIESGEVPLKDGQADLDGAYNKAIEPILAQIQQEKAAQLEKAREAKARKQAAAASLSTRQSPGGADAARDKGASKGLSVKDSIKQAIQQLS